jgi:hypothetical protein
MVVIRYQNDTIAALRTGRAIGAGRMPTFVSALLLLISVNSHPCR